MDDKNSKPDIFEDVCRMITGASILSEQRCHKEEVSRFLEIMPLDRYPEEQVKKFRDYVFGDNEESRIEIEKRKQMVRNLLAGFGIKSNR